MNQADTLRVRKSTFVTHIIAGRFQVAAKKSGEPQIASCRTWRRFADSDESLTSQKKREQHGDQNIAAQH
jgi:hypothetical protein